MEKANLKTEVTEELGEKIENKLSNIEENEKNKEEVVVEDVEKIKKIEKQPIEENKENPKEKKTKKKFILPIIILCIIALIAIIFSTIFALININNKNIISGVKIEEIDVSGLSLEEAKAKLELVYNEKAKKEMLLKHEDYDTTINPELLEAKYDVENAVKEAISIGKSNNIIMNNYDIIFALIGKKNINVNMTINEEVAKQTIEDISVNIPGAVTEPGYYIEEQKLIVTKGKEGLKVDTENLIKKIKENLENINITQEYIEIPVIEKIPEKIDIEKIHEEIYKEVQDAYYTKDPFTIHPEVEGVDFNLEEAKKILEEDKEQYEINLIITKPKVTTSQIGTEAFPDLLGTCTTRYDASVTGRTTNLRIACQKINDKVILPGEIFSYNKALGERTLAAGYKNGKVYENGQVVDGIGGGICQISSTLYNAILKANMEATERRNHQFVTSYLPAGQDATVVYGLTDFKFKNTRKYAVKIKASISNGIATVSIYGIKEENEYTVSFSTKTISTIPYTVKYVEDSSLPAGKEKVSQAGANGLITETYIIKSLNGKVVSSKLLSRDTYSAMQRIILRGKSANTTTNTNNKTNTNTNVNNNKNEQNNKEEKPKEEKPVDTKPVDTKPIETKPTENKVEVNNSKENDKATNSNTTKEINS